MESLNSVLSSGEEAQVAFENACMDIGRDLYHVRNSNLISRKMESITGYGKHWLAVSITLFSDTITAFLEDAENRPGRHHRAVKYLRLLDPDVIAFIASRTIFDTITSGTTIQSVALRIAGRLRDEVRITSMKGEERPLYEAVLANLKDNPKGYQQRVRREQMIHTMKKFDLAVVDWPKTDLLAVGAVLVHLFVEATGLVELVRHRRGKKTYVKVTATQALLDAIERYNTTHEVLKPPHRPMIAPPRPWTTLDDGGYYTDHLGTDLVQTKSRGHRIEMSLREMPLVYEAVNLIQSVPWRINNKFLTVYREIKSAGITCKGFPSHVAIPEMLRPNNFDTFTKEAKRDWMMVAGETYRNEQSRKVRVSQIRKITDIAEELSEKAAIWFPHRLDFRGRLYAIPTYLSPQGSDLAKALLEFAESKPLGDTGSFWLKVHVANMFGYDKVALEERAKWADDHANEIESTANDPIVNTWWTKADKPFQFLAAASEFVGYLAEGPEYECSLPVLVDGSNNGCQHFSAMLRDEVCGALVNLTPAEHPADIYTTVADGVIDALGASAKDETLDDDKRAMARVWLDYGINRKMVKRCVMILPYGGTREAVKGYLKDAVFDRKREEEQENPFGRELNRALSYLAGIVWRVMSGVVIGPRNAMDWLQSVSRTITKHTASTRVPISWTTPSGFLVQQRYVSTKARRVETTLGERVLKLTVRVDTDHLDGQKMAQAIAPNFVHSLDAAALAFTIVKAAERGVTCFTAVHDSYGTLPADMPVLQQALREVFVDMYTEHDPLREFSEQVAGLTPEPLPPLPPHGSLDIRGVLESDFFFA